MSMVLSVGQFIEAVNELISGDCVVEGEVIRYNISQNKWVFFDLKDDQAVLRCFSTIFTLGAPLEEGMRVHVFGYAKIHSKSGSFSFTVRKVVPVGDGSLKQAFLLLKKQLTDEGLFDVTRKRPLPILPERIGVIASRDSAAWGDFKRIISARWGGVEILLRHVAVQGEEAVSDIVSACRAFNSDKISCDVLVVIRGGGSVEDLAAFNNEAVVRALYGSRIPVVVGVGHERDETLVDYVADVRASTPTHAAELVVPDKHDFMKQCDADLDHIFESLEHAMQVYKQNIVHLSTLLVNAIDRINQHTRNLCELFDYSWQFLMKKLQYYRQFVTSAEILLKNIDPEHILRQGYSIVRDVKGKIVVSPNQVDVDDAIVVELAKGRIQSTVTHTSYGR